MVEHDNYLHFLKHLQLIWGLKEQCRKLSKSDAFKETDVRNTYYCQIMNVINDYYLGMLSPFFVKRLELPFQQGVLRSYFPLEEENDLFANLGFLYGQQYLKTWHDMKKASLVYSLWIVFEENIDLIYQKLVSEKELEINQYSNYNKIRKLIEGKISQEDIDLIKDKLKSEYIGINNKYNYVLNFLTLDSAQAKKLVNLRNFLQFFNLLRNTLHTNSRPMKDYKIKLDIGSFDFKKDQHIDFFTFDILFYSIEKLIEIFTFIRENLNFDDEIFNSTTMVENTYK